MPLKLLIVSLLLALSVPIVLENLEEYGKKVDLAAMKSQIKELKRAAEAVFLAGPGNARMLKIDLPTSAQIILGGDLESTDSFSIRCLYRGMEVAKEWIDNPPFHIVPTSAASSTLSSSCQVLLSCVQLGDAVIVSTEVIS